MFSEIKYCKLEVFLPETHIESLKNVLFESDAGHIGKYDRCLSYSKVISTWRPLEGTDPYIGTAGEMSEEEEMKIEVTVETERLQDIIPKIKTVHPYEEPVINIIPLIGTAYSNQTD